MDLRQFFRAKAKVWRTALEVATSIERQTPSFNARLATPDTPSLS